MASPDEVKRGDFVFRDTLFVDLGSGKRHTRAAESELRDLLLPTKKSSAPTKDQVAHWYEAQLLHYGLPRAKDKNLAKVRLTQALGGGGKLAVPDDVKEMEAAMKKEWHAAVRKAAKGSTASEPKASSTTGGGKKRKAADVDDGDLRTASGPKMKLTYNGMTVDLDLPAPKAARPKATPKKLKTEAAPAKAASSSGPTTTTKKPKKTEAAPARGTSTAARGKMKAASATPARSISAAAGGGGAASTNKAQARSKQTARRSGGFTANNPSYRPQPSPTSFHKPNTVMGDAYDDDNHGYDDDDNDAPPPYDSLDFSHSPTQRRQPEKSSSSNKAIQITGNYDITATSPYSPIPNATFLLVKDPTTHELWGSLTLPGKLRCVLYAAAGAIDDLMTYSQRDGQRWLTLPVSWRAEDTETGQFMFRRENRGQLSFDGAGALQGTVFGVVSNGNGDVAIEGDLTHGYGLPSAGELRGKWLALARRAYGRQ